MKTAFITRISGQDGYSPARFLLKRGYSVHGFIQSESSKGILLALSQDEIKNRQDCGGLRYQEARREVKT